MAIDSTHFELFQKGKNFDQIYFLDNFYENVKIDQENENDLIKLLTAAINTSNIYVKRSAFKVLCELTLAKKITNVFTVVGLLLDFLSSDESILQTVALKFLPYFEETQTVQIQEKLNELSDNLNGEVASQSYFCLGLIQLTNGISQGSIVNCIITLEQAKPYFQAAIQSTENRVDAEFYILLIEWSKGLLNNNMLLIQSTFKELEKNISFRNFYEFTENGLELDFLVFQLIEQIKASFDITSKSKQWLEIPPQIQALLDVSIEIQKIKNTASTSQFLTKRLFLNVFEDIANNIYQLTLTSEKERLQILLSKTDDSQLEEFIKQLLEVLPNNAEPQSESPELLALLAENIGSKNGLQQYEQISNKNVSSEVLEAIRNLLRKNQNSRLPFRTGSTIGQEVLVSLECQIENLLPDYSPEKHEAFFNIVEEVIRYARISLVGNDKKRFQFLFSESDGGKGQKAVEQDLQDSMILFFEHSKIADGLSHEQTKFIDGGRVDILYKKDIITIPIELKKSLNRPDQKALEQNYIAQAQTYTAGYDQLAIFVLLELSDKSTEPPPNFKDWFKVHHLHPSSSFSITYPDYVISVIIPGNRTSPSKKSTYK